MNYIEIDLSNIESMGNYDRVAGKQGESKAKGLRFVIPSEYSEWNIYVETENANREARRYPVTRDENDTAVYKFRKKDLEAKGRLLVDLILEKDDMVFKPFSGEFAVKFAICASDDEFEDVEVDLTGYALKADIPTQISQLKNDIGYISEKELNKEVNMALEAAKASGDFKGDPGESGADGLSAYQIWLDTGNTGTEEDFLASLKGADGVIGSDGTSATHEWNGTVLTITSASGTSSVDLKGERGNSGVYVGSDTMPDDCNVKINPKGSVIKMPTKLSQLVNDSNFVTAEYVTNAINGSLDEIEAMIDESGVLE